MGDRVLSMTSAEAYLIAARLVLMRGDGADGAAIVDAVLHLVGDEAADGVLAVLLALVEHVAEGPVESSPDGPTPL